MASVSQLHLLYCMDPNNPIKHVKCIQCVKGLYGKGFWVVDFHALVLTLNTFIQTQKNSEFLFLVKYWIRIEWWSDAIPKIIEQFDSIRFVLIFVAHNVTTQKLFKCIKHVESFQHKVGS